MQFSSSIFNTRPSGIAGCLCSTRGLGATEATYQVRSGDNVSLITWRFNRPAEDVLTLYSVNSAEIGPNPNALKEGQILYLPYGWSPVPTRSGVPDRTWVNQAATALKSVGFSWTAPPSTPTPPALPPATPPNSLPPPNLPPNLSPMTSGGTVVGVAAVCAIGYFGWKWWKKRR